MRIISGAQKGRRLVSPKTQSIRPTSDRIKESIFNILGKEVEGRVVLDLFAGTGSLGIEALSRGAKKVVFVEKGRNAIRLIEKNLIRCGFDSCSEIVAKDVHRAIGSLKRREESFNLIIIDPPYRKGLVQKTLKKLKIEGIYTNESILIIQHDQREPLDHNIDGFELIHQRKIGDTLISFLIPFNRE